MSVRVIQGDCRAVLPTLADQSVHAVVTSPPYFGLRSYGVGAENGEIGLEQTPAEFVAVMVDVFRELRRVLRDDGLVWLNLGDSYASAGGHSSQGDSRARVGRANVDIANAVRGFRAGLQAPGIKTKDLMMIPHRVAIALQDDGWWVRQGIVWSKPNPMPESVTDRPTTAHEFVFMLAKSGDATFWTHRDGKGARTQPDPDYRWLDRDNQNAEQPAEPDGWQDAQSSRPSKLRWRRINLWRAHDYFYDAEAVREPGTVPAGTRGAKGSAERAAQAGVNSRPPEYKVYDGTRGLRSVWQIATRPFSEAHFATFPPELPETCIKASTSERGCCPVCGAGWVRMLERVDSGRIQKMADGWDVDPGGHGTVHRSGRTKGEAGVPVMINQTTGWSPSCGCPAADPVPCTILDPFGGAGTTALVADRLGRNAISIELNAEYAAMQERRITRDAGLFAEVSA